MAQKMGLAEWLMLLFLSLVWGSSFIFNELALGAFGPLELVFGRVFIGALALTLILRTRGITLPRDLASWQAFLVMALFQNALPFSLIVWGQQHITASLASIFNATTPFFTVILAQLFTGDEKITPMKLMGLLAGFAGVVVIIGPEALEGLTHAGLGKFAVLGAALCYGISLVWARRFASFTPGVAPMGMLWCSSAIMLFAVLVFGDHSLPPLASRSAWLAMLGLGVLCSAVAYLLFFTVISRAGATNASLVTFLVPASAILMGHLLLGDLFALQTLPGVALIFLGLTLVDGRLFMRRAREAV